MDQWLSLYTRIVALLEVIRERGVTLGPSSLGALQSLVRFFCEWVYTASSGADLPPSPTVTGLSLFPPQGWERSGKKGSVCLDPISEGDKEDTHSIPDSLPDLIDSAGEEEHPSPIGLVERGIAPRGYSYTRIALGLIGFGCIDRHVIELIERGKVTHH